MTQQKTDLFALNRKDYTAWRKPRFAEVESGWYLCVEGRGGVDGREYLEGRQALARLGRALQARAAAAGQGFKLCRRETLWHMDPGYFDITQAPDDALNWAMCMRLPDSVGENELEEVKAALAAKGEVSPALRLAVAMGMEEGRCAQMLHVGPREALQDSIRALYAFIEEREAYAVGRLHEVALNDPARTAPERQRVLLRVPVM
ncbi:GyrI-like domain-containing protein [Fundidesulfovibrio soli]|uniref:GyrI-like domain-containing protein n=1 Tax=Fundidesulfovibrio soli TaxID=2922716 RepID=UPI001FAFD939|nr:GyrI-like domain-containing protein [Fundidesulfovibrio soli]